MSDLPSAESLKAAFARGKARARAAQPQHVPNIPASAAFVPEDVLALVDESKRRRESRRVNPRRVPRGNGPAQAARGYVCLPPPHIQVPRTVDSVAFRDAALRQAALRGYRDVGGLPWWAWHVAARCHRRNWREEVRRLPREWSLRVQKAAEFGRTEPARRSIAAIGCVIVWMAIRHPKRVGRPTNVGGISGASLQLLTQNGKKLPYSLSSIQHANHSGAGRGVVADGEAGFLEHLRSAGAVKSWIPPAGLVPDWMRGFVHAFAIFALPSALERLAPS